MRSGGRFCVALPMTWKYPFNNSSVCIMNGGQPKLFATLNSSVCMLAVMSHHFKYVFNFTDNIRAVAEIPLMFSIPM